MPATKWILIVLLTLAPSLFAEKDNVPKQTTPRRSSSARPAHRLQPMSNRGTHNFGIAAGFSTGNGLSYRYWFNNGFGIQLTTLPIYSHDEYSEEANVNAGLSGLKKVYETRVVDLLVFAAARYDYHVDKSTYTPTQWEPHMHRDNEEEHIFTGGFGSGPEVRLGPFSLNLLFGLRGQTNFDKVQNFGFTVESGVYFGFRTGKGRKENP